MKRITLIFDCGCSVTLWAETRMLLEARHNCGKEEHEEDAATIAPCGPFLEGKKISHVSIEPAPENRVSG